MCRPSNSHSTEEDELDESDDDSDDDFDDDDFDDDGEPRAERIEISKEVHVSTPQAPIS